MAWASPALRQHPGAPAQQVGEGALGFPSVRTSSNSQSSHTDFAQPFPVITPKGLQSPPGLFSKCQHPALLSFRRQELPTPLGWQQVGVSAALPGAGRLRADTFPRVGVTGRAVGASHNKGSLLQLKPQPKTSSPGCWGGMTAIQVNFGETINSPQSKAANSQFSSSPVTATHHHPNPGRVCA